MSFTSTVAGPSRLPLQAIASSSRRSAASTARRYAATVSRRDEDPKTLGDAKYKYERWVSEEGAELAFPEKGKKAKWLGGDVPFALNPSFRPPPPIGSQAQNALHSEMRKKDKTLGQVSEEFNVSKARLLAIQKLKQVEDEFKRQNLPLQTAFRDGVEPLLGVQTMAQALWGRDTEGNTRVVDKATLAELEEEGRWEAGIGQGGAFADRSRTTATEGIERTVYEWRGEDETIAARSSGEPMTEAFPTPASVSLAKKVENSKHTDAARPERVVPAHSSTTTFRFVDVSEGGVQQTKQVQKAIARRSKLTAKRKQYRERSMGVFK